MKKWFAGIFSWSSNFLNTVYWICQSKNDQKCEQNSREWQSMKFEYLELVHHGDSSEILSHLYTKWYASMYSFSMTTRVEHIIAQQTECRIVSNKLICTNIFNLSWVGLWTKHFQVLNESDWSSISAKTSMNLYWLEY